MFAGKGMSNFQHSSVLNFDPKCHSPFLKKSTSCELTAFCKHFVYSDERFHPLSLFPVSLIIASQSFISPHPHPNASQRGSSSQFQFWTVQLSAKMIPAQPQLLVAPPFIPSALNHQLGRGKKVDFTNYWPILNSYIKIAPQPYKRGPEDSG